MLKCTLLKFHNAMKVALSIDLPSSVLVSLDLLQSMASVEEVDFSETDSGASHTFPAKCSSLKKSGYVMIGKRPGKILRVR